MKLFWDHKLISLDNKSQEVGPVEKKWEVNQGFLGGKDENKKARSGEIEGIK